MEQFENLQDDFVVEEETEEVANMGMFQDKVCLVVGGASGLGTAIAERFAKEGGKVVIADIDEERAQAEAEEINNAGGEAIAVKVDVRDSATLEQMIEKTVNAFGRLDVAVNSAARVKDTKPIAEMDIREYDDIMDINLKGVILSMKYELTQMVEQGDGGAIVNISAISGLVAQNNVPAHTAAKSALLGLTKSAAMDYSPHGIRINIVAPGAIKTPEAAAAFAKFNFRSTDYFDSLSMMNRAAEVAEVVDAITWLASDHASFVTGITLPIDGGYTAK